MGSEGQDGMFHLSTGSSARHVKCDETRPVCKKCVTAGRVCSGVNYGAASGSGSGSGSGVGLDGAALSIRFGSGNAGERSTDNGGLEAAAVKGTEEKRRMGSLQTMPWGRGMRLTRDVVPQGWHFSEACQY
ncbi:hypothetical protein E4U53_001002, partial [Claviceps sorghi]